MDIHRYIADILSVSLRYTYMCGVLNIFQYVFLQCIHSEYHFGLLVLIPVHRVYINRLSFSERP